MSSEQGRTISHFRVERRLGHGGMGVVYEARDTVLKRRVALKLIRPDLTQDPVVRSRFLRECQAEAAVSHPGVATLFEAGETDDGELFFAAELVEGETLLDRMDRLERPGRLGRIERDGIPLDEAIDLSIQLADALAAAHRQGIVHRDIKPANLMVQPDGRLRILDFGLARLNEPPAPEAGAAEDTATRLRTMAGAIMGTPAYMSPEQISGDPVDVRTDVFAAGCVIYEMICGEQPFRGDTNQATFRKILVAEPSAPENLSPAVPPAFGKIIQKALAKDRGDRYADAGELAEALRSLQSHGGSAAASKAAGRRVRPWWSAVAAVVAISAVALGVWYATRPTLAFGERDDLLIVNTDNQTGEEAFDLALRTALEEDLRQSPYARVFDRSQVAQTLELMRMEPSAPVDEAVGRDICRFAGVRALLLPRVFSAGEAYELQAILIDPVSGRHVTTMRVAARGKEEVLLTAVDELTRKVRKGLGESIASIERADQPVVQVTTRSWEALRYFSMASERTNEARLREAAALYELALQKDPQFAVARATLGLTQYEMLGQQDEGKENLAQALADAEGLPERERLMIKAVNLQYVDGDLEGALEQYRLVRQLYPHLMQPYNNAGRVLFLMGRYDEAVEMFEKAAELAPKNSIPIANLYFIHLNYQHDPQAAQAIADRLVALAPESAQFQHMLSWSLIAQRRYQEALIPIEDALADEPRHRYSLPNRAYVLTIVGRADEAVPIFRDLLDSWRADTWEGYLPRLIANLGVSLTSAGRYDEAEQLALEGVAEIETLSIPEGQEARRLLDLAYLEALAGLPDEAVADFDDALAMGVTDPYAMVLAAEVLAVLGRHDEAIAQVETALANGLSDVYYPMVLPALDPIRDDPRYLALF